MKRLIAYFIGMIFILFLNLQCQRQSTSISDDSIIIFKTGGGFYGGINPTTLSKTTIYSSGVVILTQGTLFGDTTETTLKVSKTDIGKLAEIIIQNGFFDMANLYDCTTGDTICENKKKDYPTPVPLVLESKINDHYNKIKIEIMDNDFIEYPAGLDTILSHIERLITKAKE